METDKTFLAQKEALLEQLKELNLQMRSAEATAMFEAREEKYGIMKLPPPQLWALLPGGRTHYRPKCYRPMGAKSRSIASIYPKPSASNPKINLSTPRNR